MRGKKMIKSHNEDQDNMRKLGSIHEQINMAEKKLENLNSTILEEKRKHKRTHMVASAELLIKGEPTIETYSINISRGGICLHTNRFLPVDTKVWVRLSYMKEGKNKAIEGIEGNVRWCKPLDQILHGVGIEFKKLDSMEHSMFLAYIGAVESTKKQST